jgi:hypothetical protein
MKKPADTDKIRCPEDDNTTYTPTHVWDSKLPDKTRVRYGLLEAHRHFLFGDDCPWSGLAVVVES